MVSWGVGKGGGASSMGTGGTIIMVGGVWRILLGFEGVLSRMWWRKRRIGDRGEGEWWWAG